MPPLVDEETRQVIIKKTWCHGQLVLPLFSLLYAVEFFRPGSSHRFNFLFLWAALVLPLWSYQSYAIIAVVPPHGSFQLGRLLWGGALAQTAHVGILVTVVVNGSGTLDTLLTIASGLFLVETFAFLCVAWKLPPPVDYEGERRRVVPNTPDIWA